MIYEFVMTHPLLTAGITLIFLRFYLMNSRGPFQEYPGHQVRAIKSVEEWREVMDLAKKDKKIVVCDFYALWCGPCRYSAPHYGRVSTGMTERLIFTICIAFYLSLPEYLLEYEDVIFLKVDVDELKSIALDNQVNAMPTVAVYKDGRKVDYMTGWNESRLRVMIQKQTGAKSTLYPTL